MTIETILHKYGLKQRGKTIFTQQGKAKGSINENNLFFYTDFHPFKQGLNFLSDFQNNDFNINDFKADFEKIKENERTDFNITTEQYLNVTNGTDKLLDYFQNYFDKELNPGTDEFCSISGFTLFNKYYVRSVKSGYLEDATIFPYIDVKGNFVTAQIIKYDDNGKRNKGKFSSNWLHAYKPIKQDLKLKDTDKYSVPVKCFFGEHLLGGSSNPVAIVESQKTAIVLSQFFTNIDFIATGGEQQIKGKKLDVLQGRNVILFPDAHTTLWSEFAKDNGFECSSILENEKVRAGADVLDIILNECNDIELSQSVYNLFSDIDNEKYIWNYKTESLHFKQVQMETKYLPIFKNKMFGRAVVLAEVENIENNVTFRGEHFNIYQNYFNVLSAQKDFNNLNPKKKSNYVTESMFKKNLERCFRVIKHFNNETYINIFTDGLDTLKSNGNFKFNEHYILQVLVPLWDSTKYDVKKYIKPRNWCKISTETLNRNDFELELNRHKKTNSLLQVVRYAQNKIENGEFIDISNDLGIKISQSGYEDLHKKCKEYNEKYLGCKTYKTYEHSNRILQTFLKMHGKSNTLYKDFSIWTVTKSMHKKVKANKISTLSGVNRNTVSYFLYSFKPEKKVKRELLKELTDLVNYSYAIKWNAKDVGGSYRLAEFELIKPIENVKDTICSNTAISSFYDSDRTSKSLKTMLNTFKDDYFKPFSNQQIIFNNNLKNIRDLKLKKAILNSTLRDFLFIKDFEFTQKEYDLINYRIPQKHFNIKDFEFINKW